MNDVQTKVRFEVARHVRGPNHAKKWSLSTLSSEEFGGIVQDIFATLELIDKENEKRKRITEKIRVFEQTKNSFVQRMITVLRGEEPEFEDFEEYRRVDMGETEETLIIRRTTTPVESVNQKQILEDLLVYLKENKLLSKKIQEMYINIVENNTTRINDTKVEVKVYPGK